MARLLILTCSQRKNPASGTLPTIERYDGPAFRLLRKCFRERTGEAPPVLVLSAKFGLIAAERQILDYNCRLIADSAALWPQILEGTFRLLQSQQWRSVGICAGKDYCMALDGFCDLVPVDFIEGG